MNAGSQTVWSLELVSGSLSSASIVVGRKTFVAAGHVTTQNLVGKKICWVEGVAALSELEVEFCR